VNCNAVSLATTGTYPPIRIPLGYQAIAVGGTIGQEIGSNIDHSFQTPVVCEAGRYFCVFLKIPTGTATASQIIRGVVLVEGYFE
jgi:hypothetical protein